MPKFSTPLASAVIFLTTCPAFAGPTINVDWIDNFTIPFTFNFSQMSSGGLNQPLNLTASTTASGLIPGFSSLDPRLGASVGIPISRSISTTFNAQVSSLTAVFGPNCTVFFPCPSDSLTQTAGISIKNLSQGISLTGSSVQSANIPSLPPSVARSLNYFISAPSPDVVTSTSSVNTGTYSFDVNLDITAPRIINREFPSVSGTVTGSIVGTTDTKVEIVGSTGGGPADKLESILIELKKSYNELARSSKEFTLAGLAASSIAYYGPAIYPPVIALTPELLDLQAEFLTTGQLLKQSFPTSIPGDPPLPSILPSGIVTGQLASQFDLFNMNSEKIVGLIQSTKNSINDTVDALSKSDLTNAAALESKISQSLSDIRTLSREQIFLLSQIRGELSGSDFSISTGQLSEYLAHILSSGFPPEEIPLFEDIGLSQSDIAALLNSLEGIDVSLGPTSLDSLLASISTGFSGISAEVDEPYVWGILFPLLTLALIIERKRKSAKAACL